jgi:hypothetical protein
VHKRLIAGATAAALLTFIGAGSAQAALPVYPNVGTQNTASYTFTATATGPIDAYFALNPATAWYTESLGLIDETTGVTLSSGQLTNHSTALGTMAVLGNVKAGDKLDFFINVNNTGNTWYSDQSKNIDGAQHVYSTSYAAGSGIPNGTYVAFEDLAKNVSDFNYHDEAFVFTNLGATSSVPEPATWAMLILGVAMIGFVVRRRSEGTAIEA